MTLTTGIHDRVAADAYHSGATATPSLSASVAKLLISKSPAHARAAHPILNPDLVREQKTEFDIGTAAHALLLEGEDILAVWAGKDWRTNEAKAFKATAYDEGRIPAKLDQAHAVRAMAAAARDQLQQHAAQPPLFVDGKPEQTLVWEDEGGVVCRARLDWLRDDYEAVDDYKTTGASADPMAWTRTMYGMGADVQVAFYIRSVERLTGIRPLFRFAVQETYEPYALSVVDLAPAAIALAETKVDRAITLWAECLEKDFWPAYPTAVASIELPTWEELRWLEREGQQEEAA